MSELPDPLTPPDCDLRTFPFMPIDIARLFASHFHAVANDAEWRAGVTLWLKSFHQVPAGSIPGDEREQCRLAELGRDLNGWRKIKKVALHGWIECSDGRLYHPVVCEKTIEAFEKKRFFKKRSKTANDARWGSRDPVEGETPETETAKEAKTDPSRNASSNPTSTASSNPSIGSQVDSRHFDTGFTSTVEANASTSEVPPARGGADLPAEKSDEDLFWSLAKECDAKGIARSRLGKLLKLAHAGATTIPAATRLLQSCLKAKDPSTYFGATIRQIEEDAGITRAKQMKAGKKVPPWVAEWREAGETVTPVGPNQWSSRGNTYDDEGRLIGW
jgi:hypothetical protein